MNDYGPSSGDKPEVFFNVISSKIEETGNEQVIIGGDWNVVLNMKSDACNCMSIATRPRARNRNFELMTMHDLVNVIGKQYPEKKTVHMA